jgi:hypothetical protein
MKYFFLSVCLVSTLSLATIDAYPAKLNNSFDPTPQ